MTRDELDALHAESEAIGEVEAMREWGEALRASLLASLGPDAPAAVRRAVERPGWTAKVLDDLRRTIDGAELFAVDLPGVPIFDPDEPRITMSRASFHTALREVASAAVQAALLSVLNTQRSAASAGAKAVNVEQKAKAADLRARIREVWMTPVAQGRPSLNAACVYVAQRVGCGRSTVQSAVEGLTHPKRAAKK